MINKKIIKKFVAFFLLGVFLLGITPKKTLHNLFADHRDYSSTANNGSSEQLSNAGYNCKCDDIVANSPFTTIAYLSLLDVTVYKHFVVYPGREMFSVPLLFSNLRGPPVKL